MSRPRELSEARITRIDLNLEPGAISAGVIARFDFVCGPTLVRGARLQRHCISKELTVFLPKTRFKDETIRFTCDAARVRLAEAAEAAVAAASARAAGWRGDADG